MKKIITLAFVMATTLSLYNCCGNSECADKEDKACCSKDKKEKEACSHEDHDHDHDDHDHEHEHEN